MARIAQQLGPLHKGNLVVNLVNAVRLVCCVLLELYLEVLVQRFASLARATDVVLD